MDSASVLCERDGPVAVVVLNEPNRRNPMSPAIIEGLIEIFEKLNDDDDVRVVTLTGSGRGFCAGADLGRMRTATPLEDRQEYDRILVLNEIMWNYPKPTIAAVHGFALGAGANLMSWCDLIVADKNTKIGYPEVKAGVPSATVIPNLQRLVGRRRMLELTLLGTPILAAEAERIGLINRVVPTGEALAVAKELACEMAKNDPHAMRQTKEIARNTSEMNYREAMIYAKEVRVIVRMREGFDVHVAQGSNKSKNDARD
ncbi:MAG: methylglutaconyl-CoA hydratase [Gammaproteobacteria bacterium]|jgi:methylglutaconyl-CoA hydratase